MNKTDLMLRSALATLLAVGAASGTATAHAAKASGIALRYFRLVKARLNANKDAEPESDTGR